MNTKKEPFLTCKDYNVSRETFKLILEVDLDMLVTYPQPKEIDLGKYYESDDYISHTDSNKTLFEKAYQKAKKIAIKNKIKLVNQGNKTTLGNKKLLDIGCGTGDFLNACQNKGFNVVGIEPNKKARVLAKNKIGILTSKINYIDNDYPKIFESINHIEEKFDTITMWHVLEHVPNLKNYITQLKQLLKPDGTLIIAVPNYKSFDAKHYKEFWAAYDVPRHLWHFSQKSIKMLFQKEQLKVEKTLPMKMDSYYVSLLSEKNKNGKGNPIKAFFIGFISNLKAISTKEYSSLTYILKND